jgi:8-oxo-dGTP diphosphatase
MVDLGETMQEAAAREALEETGLHVEVGDVYWTVDAIRHDADGRVRYHNVIVDFIATVRDGELACADDAMDVRWVGSDEVEALPITSTMWPLLEKLFGRRFSGGGALQPGG